MTNSDFPSSADITELEIWRMISQDVKERIAEGDGFWRSCSGCCETSDGYNVNGYPHSSVFGCELGSGCSECGGIGAVWDNLDYSQVGEDGVTGDVAQSSQVTDADLLAKAQIFIDRKYVARADERQKSMGLAYVEAERQDLAREIVRFVRSIYP